MTHHRDRWIGGSGDASERAEETVEHHLDDADQVRAFNLLEAISATITPVEGQQMECEMTRKTGSHRKSKVCMTRAQRDQLREDSKYVMEKAYNGLCFKGGSACGFGSDN